MVELKPSLRVLSPTLSELFWEQAATDQLLGIKIHLISEIKQTFSSKIEEIRSGYQTLTIRWADPTFHSEIIPFLDDLELVSQPLPDRTWEIPVCYDSEFGYDLNALAKAKSLAVNEVIRYHSQASYRIHFIGFLPGFPYLSGMNPILAMPRKSQPDRAIPAGSVAIGGNQTGIYPQRSPGGWHIIGRTPIPLFDPNSSPPVAFQLGDQLVFRPIDKSEFDRIRKFKPQLLR
ncbi:5-oxoprolinase subunit PxpB [Algoriphagus sp.]|uniref:5-oxoprolinase subunit PxpB n=1 Tax=Algoriphagus sp. TaxID=1872435 RepID=UPI00262FBC51|nr:5-oxoprolinase subunit PxpB [Algoriphagus sp.]